MARIQPFVRLFALVFLLLGSNFLQGQFYQIGEPQTDSFPDITVKLGTRDPQPRTADFFKVKSGSNELPHLVTSTVGPDSGQAKSVLILWELLSYPERNKQNAYFRELLKEALPDLLQQGDQVSVATFAWTDLEGGTRTLNFLNPDFSEDVTDLLEKVESAKPPGGKNVQANHGSELFPAMTEGIGYLTGQKDRAKVMVVLSAEFPNLYNPKSDNALVIAKAREAEVAIYNYRYKVKAAKYNLNEIASATYGQTLQVDPEDIGGSVEQIQAQMDAASRRSAGMEHQITFTTDHENDGKVHQVQIVGGTESITVGYNAPAVSLMERIRSNLLWVIIIAVLVLGLVVLLIVMSRRRKLNLLRKAQEQQREIDNLAEKGEAAETRLAQLAEERQKEDEKRRQADLKARELEAQKDFERLRAEMFSGGKSPRISVFLGESSEIIELPGPVVVIGRASDSDIAIDHDTISRHHAQIVYENGVYHLQDLGSTNGTFHNGNSAEQAVLKHGDTITCGSVRVMFYL